MAKTDRIEIRPGFFIEVSHRLRRKAGVPKGARLRPRLTNEDRQRILGEMFPPKNRNNRYSTLLLDEAVRLSKTVGELEASRITGVKYWSLKGRKRVLIRDGKYQPTKSGGNRSRYTLAQKQRCVELAKQIADKDHCALRPAFVRAGKLLGVNGRSVQWMYAQRQFVPSSPPPRS